MIVDSTEDLDSSGFRVDEADDLGVYEMSTASAE